MKTKLNLFDRLMMAVTFAEAGVDLPEVGNAGDSCRHCKGKESPKNSQTKTSRPGERSIAAVRS